MSVTAKEVTDSALNLVFHVTEGGALDRTREARYRGVAPSYLTVLQYELAGLENQPFSQPVTTLDDVISLTDKTAREIMPVGLAMYFALLDRDSELYNHFAEIYHSRLTPSVSPGEVKLRECYLKSNDPMMG